ncbi:siderophore-interacting protein [Dactylosporangium sp. NPDC005572]|uniref:siderophore-interacting protein n=1 Tax=Dactylosporangium sp. NPDC005572 TaxID=3156889 RepID=UPI0033AFF9FC
MPTVPAPIASRFERWLGHPALVTAVDQHSAALRTVTFAGPALRGLRDAPGQEIEFRVGPRELRHYTAARYDPAAGELDVVFHTAADGPGARWAAALTTGAETSVLGPGGGLRWQPGRDTLLLGDATAIGLFQAFSAASAASPAASASTPASTSIAASSASAAPSPTAASSAAAGSPGSASGAGGVRASLRGAVEVPAADLAAARALLPGLEIVEAGDEPGRALDAWLAAASIPSSTRVYLAGHARSIQRQRATLKAAGVSRSDLLAKAHWADGRAGL